MSGSTALDSLGPLDGRYAELTAPLAQLFCERALITRRYRIEVAWLQALIAIDNFGPTASEAILAGLDRLANKVPADLALRVKESENKTRHDVKAVELQLIADLHELGLTTLVPWVHFACTSWDINNLAYALMVQEARTHILEPALTDLRSRLDKLAVANAELAMLGRTHGQPASPTTLGKELRVFEQRLSRQLKQITNHTFDGKFNGAVGNYNAHRIAAPDINWQAVTCSFVTALGLQHTAITTQIEPYDGMVDFFDKITRTNRILLDLAQDLSLYTGYGYLCLATKDEEVGSSTMPHKVNPIDFENAEGNLLLANALLQALGQNLQISRMQRDLSDSTVVRNIGVALGHASIAWHSLARGLANIEGNATIMAADLQANWQVLAEAVQTVLRTCGSEDAYDRLKEATRGKQSLTEDDYLTLVKQVVPAGTERDILLALRPETYLGDAVTLARSCYCDDDTGYKKGNKTGPLQVPPTQ